jgi:glycosyltransferase involved in cell wall biosynthesis
MPAGTTILLFTDWYEPGFKAGGPIQSCKNIVNTLAGELDFRIFTSDRDLGDKEPYRNVITNTWVKLSNGAQIWYASPEFIKSSNIRKIIADVNPQTVYLNSMFSPGFSLLPLWVLGSLRFNGRIILAPRGMLNTSALSRKKWKKKIFLSLFSLTRISKKVIFHATCLQEVDDIKKYFRNNIRIEMVEEMPNIYGTWDPRNKQQGQLNCVFISRIHSIKNLLFAINVVKNLTGCSVLFDIYGPVEDEKYFQKCKLAASGASAHVKINFKGPILSSKVFETLQNYHVFFLPTEGENFGHIIFEAFTSGCVLLISDKTPWKELDDRNAGWALPLNDNRKFADKLRQLCAMNEEVFNEKSKAAFQYARDYLASTNLKNRYATLFQPTE